MTNPRRHILSIETLAEYDSGAADNIAYLNSLHLIGVGVTPFPRITPSFFLDTYQIYSALAPTDIEVLRRQTRVATLEERFPKEAAKVHATNYLLGNHRFQGFLRAQRHPPTLLLSNTTNAIQQKLEELDIPYLGTRAETAERFKTKRVFRDTLERLGLPVLHRAYVTHTALQEYSFAEFASEYFPSAVIQRADKEVGGNKSTFFISDKSSFDACMAALADEPEDTEYLVSEFVHGPSVSMLGCATSQGVLTGTLQLQLIDVHESLHGHTPGGIFFGNDWGFRTWSDEAEQNAQRVVEQIGELLYQEGYRGIFGVDFIVDAATGDAYPLECNPRITGALPAHSLMLLSQNVPPLEYFHLLALTGRDDTFDFEKSNAAVKARAACAHISISPVGIPTMRLPLRAGVYAYDAKRPLLEYRRPGFHFDDIRSPEEFIMIDTVPAQGTGVPQAVPGFFKFIFNESIADGTHTVHERVADLLTMFSNALLKDSSDK